VPVIAVPLALAIAGNPNNRIAVAANAINFCEKVKFFMVNSPLYARLSAGG
jgi:predicted transcriptional regulator